MPTTVAIYAANPSVTKRTKANNLAHAYNLNLQLCTFLLTGN